MEISEWVGKNPAQLSGNFVTFNTDIPGVFFSYTDLYLMGYVSAAEMDAGNSELRYMNLSSCAASYGGPISRLASSDIIAAAGPRVPNSQNEDRHYKCGWVMIHLPGDPPSTFELDKAVAVLEQQQLDWSLSTVGRGTLDNSLGSTTSIGAEPARQVSSFLELALPNPFGRSTALRFSVARPGPVSLTIHDVLGRRVATLVQGFRSPGGYSVVWDGSDDAGTAVVAGVYFVRLATDGVRDAQRLVVVR
jgi:hypothetical protein